MGVYPVPRLGSVKHIEALADREIGTAGQARWLLACSRSLVDRAVAAGIVACVLAG